MLESVMSALSSAAPDPDEMAACSYLLQHLAGIMARRPCRRDYTFSIRSSSVESRGAASVWPPKRSAL